MPCIVIIDTRQIVKMEDFAIGMVNAYAKAVCKYHPPNRSYKLTFSRGVPEHGISYVPEYISFVIRVEFFLQNKS